MNPAFDINRLRSFLVLFQRSATMVREIRSHNDKSNLSTSYTQLAERWKKEIKTNSNKVMVDVTTWISRLMLDNIGEGIFVSTTTNFKFLTCPEAAFEHQFNAVDAGGVGELSEAFNNLLFVPSLG